MVYFGLHVCRQFGMVRIKLNYEKKKEMILFCPLNKTFGGQSNLYFLIHKSMVAVCLVCLVFAPPCGMYSNAFVLLMQKISPNI